MKKRVFVYYLLLLLATGCGVKRYLPQGEKLYKGATIKVNKEKEVTASSKSLKKQLKQAVRPKANKYILGQPYKVWWWYVIGEPKKPKGFKSWLRSKLGEPPVLSSSVHAKSTAENMQAFLENIGYFHSTVSGDTTSKGYFMKAVYEASILPQYKIKEITWVNDSSQLLKELSARQRRSILKPGQPYRLSDIEAERDRLDLRLKTRGYYYFNPDYIMAYADSTIGNHEVNLFLNIKSTTPQNARYPYTINRIMVFPNYTLLEPPPDTSRRATVNIDGLLIRDTVKRFKPELFRRTITYRPGSIYSSRQQNTTLNRMINLGVFKFVKNRFDEVKDTGHKLNVYYYLTPSKKKSIQAEIDGFSKENKYLGTQLSLNWKNRNTFRGAELLTVKGYVGFELSPNDSLKRNNNFRLGAEASINFPRYVIPFVRFNESNLFPPRTRMLLGYEYFIKESFYTKNIFRFQYEFNWKEANNKEHTLAPIAITYLNAINVTDSFYKQAQQNPSLLLTVYNEAILGSFYSYTFNTASSFAKRQLYFNTSIDLSGNIAGLITGAKRTREKTIFNTPFAQYVKVDGDLRYKRTYRNKAEWANRLQVGIGIPYNNSAILPFSKQYVIGGSNSLRGFPVRTIGPGTYQPTKDDQRFFQIIGGDFKLLANTEYRFPIAGKLSGALFADAGNVWTKDTTIFGKAGQLTKNFYKEIAVDGGLGLRFDINVLVIRLDLGIPFRKPYYPEGQRWVFNKIDFGDRQWRRDNLIVNIAIGFPF
ncbi:translocation and assembly module lipoprotein TamL [Ferruginibacter sp.]